MTAFKDWQAREGHRLYLKGITSLSPSELLSFILRDKQAGENLLIHFDSLKHLTEASAQELKKVPGINSGRAEQLLCCFELLKRVHCENLINGCRRLRSPEDVAAFIGGEFECGDRELFKEILLNTKNGVIAVNTVAIGSLNAALVHPREVLKPAIKASAAGIILCHNHPTGDPEPSHEDVELTIRLAKACELIGIEMLDHIIIGSEGHFVSLRERGIIAS